MEGNFERDFRNSTTNTSTAILGSYDKTNFRILQENQTVQTNQSVSFQSSENFNAQPKHKVSSQDDLNKIFIGSLNYITSEESFMSYFSRFGQLKDTVIIRDPITKKSKGFGFVQYTNSSMVDEVMKNRPHTIDKRQLDVHRSMPRSQVKQSEHYKQANTLFISGIEHLVSSSQLVESDLRAFFEKYGRVVNVFIPRNKQTTKPKNYGFVTFDDYDSVDKIVIQNDWISINGCGLRVQKALGESEENKYKRTNFTNLIETNNTNQVSYNQTGKNVIYGQYNLVQSQPDYGYSPVVNYDNSIAQGLANIGPARNNRINSNRYQTPYSRRTNNIRA